MRAVYFGIGANILVAALLHWIARHQGGSPGVFPAIYTASLVLSAVAAWFASRRKPGAFRLGLVALGANAVLHYALYIINDRMIQAGRVPENDLGYLFAVTFTIAITATGFFCRPLSQERAHYGPIDVMAED